LLVAFSGLGVDDRMFGRPTRPSELTIARARKQKLRDRKTDTFWRIVKLPRGKGASHSSAEPTMHSRYLVLLVAVLLAGCVSSSRARSPKPGSNYVNNSGEWVEIGMDGKAHQSALPLDQIPIGMGTP
jgi:hypothetical protein